VATSTKQNYQLNVSTSLNSVDLTAELTKRIDLTADKTACWQTYLFSLRHQTKF